ncbi:MAG: ribosome assembly factor SBDS [Nanoarchaeota archaeon]|nr:ribosome assembly factor SBDS [Nanoarchaeota archaeon]MBU1322332.1 ribosome assembly factor SBDS [Nanoarchaeota archaeon]MBU1597800.1 ribosome assembly factor SBDS [Nanoarchaeota archaeon]MBU2441031.1 ribosome assembly factor SBDS [Nanoarchaeota archaeon]
MRQTYDKEKVSLNLARIKTHGENFEIVIDPDNAVKFRHGEGNIRDALKSEKVFKDAEKGDLASEHHMQEVFQTTDTLKVAEKIIKEGSIQVSDEYRDNLKNERKKQILEMITKDGADANTGVPVTANRLSNALREAGINIDIFRKAEDQIKEIIEKLRPVLSLTFEKKVLNIRIPSNNAAKLYGFVDSHGNIADQAWLSDGSWSCKLEISAGLVTKFVDELKSKTRGDVEIEIEKKQIAKQKKQ